MEALHVLQPLILLLLVGVLAIAMSRRLGLSPIVGYLMAGLLIGPHGLDWAAETSTTHLLAELGVVFLLFEIGMHFSIGTIWEARRDIFGLGPLQILLCAIVFTWGATIAGIPIDQAALLGGGLALSSTAVVVQTLRERQQQGCPVGRTATAVLIFQDIFAIFLLVLASGSTGAAGADVLSALGTALGKGAVAFVAAVAIGRYLVDPLFRFLARSMNEDIFTPTALLVVLATAVATASAELSLTLGAFLGGMIIGETPYRSIIQSETKPFRALLLGFFFITIGMSLDWRAILADAGAIVAFLFLLLALKTLLVAASARVFGWSNAGAIQLGALLAQGSEFAFVIVAMPAVRAGLGEQAVGIVVAGVAVSLALTPSVAALGNAAARRIRRWREPADASGPAPSTSTVAPVVVFGLDEVGRRVADALESHGLRYDAVEMDYDRFLRASADGYAVAFGDLGDVRLMQALSIDERSSVVITIARYEVSRDLTPVIDMHFPGLRRFVSVDDAVDRTRFEALGLSPVVAQSVPRGLELAAEVLRSEGVSDDRVREWMEREQERFLGDDSAEIAAA
ncbi:MAG: cation:proton antiporter [bacterium]|nr:cation:proton antiporter [bacterium]